MCQLVDDYIKNKQISSIILLFKNGASFEIIQKSFLDFSVEEIEEIKNKIKN